MCSYKEINEWFKWENTPVKDRKLQSVEKNLMITQKYVVATKHLIQPLL